MELKVWFEGKTLKETLKFYWILSLYCLKIDNKKSVEWGRPPPARLWKIPYFFFLFLRPSLTHLIFVFFRNMSAASVITDDYKQKTIQTLREERKKILKISINKLQRIQDPETVLCRSVLINNTLTSIKEEHKQSQMRVKLKRQKKSYCDELEPKRICLGDRDRNNGSDADSEEGDFSMDDVRSDTTRPLALCTFNKRILCDNTAMSNNTHVWCEEELEQVGSEEIEDRDVINNFSIDFSISALSYKHSANRCSHISENSNTITSTEDYSGTHAQYVDSFPANSMIHNRNISLKSWQHQKSQKSWIIKFTVCTQCTLCIK